MDRETSIWTRVGQRDTLGEISRGPESDPPVGEEAEQRFGGRGVQSDQTTCRNPTCQETGPQTQTRLLPTAAGSSATSPESDLTRPSKSRRRWEERGTTAGDRGAGGTAPHAAATTRHGNQESKTGKAAVRPKHPRPSSVAFSLHDPYNYRH